MEVEGEDECVQEFDVFIGQCENLQLFQYPLRPAARGYGDQGKLVKAQSKEQLGILKLEYELVQKGNYDSNAD